MDVVSIAFSVLGGLALFLFGLKYLSDGLKKATGEQMKRLLEKLTNRTYKGVLLGTFTTGIIQSSSMTMVTLIGLINAGTMTFRQGVGVMLGAEIGTTVTAQLLAFRIGTTYFPILAIGFLLWMAGRSQKVRNLGEIMVGFGILFLGMDIMSGGLKPLASEPYVASMLSEWAKTPVLGVIAGAVVTGIIQSSSAMTGIVIAMGREGVITLPAAIALVFGANIGTTVTGLIASLGSSLSSRRLSAAQILINVAGVVAFTPFILPYSSFISATSTDLPRQIANAHSIFNIVVTLAMIPLAGALVWLITRLVPGEDVRVDGGLKYINAALLKTPTLAVQSCKKEIMRMGGMASDMLKDSQKMLLGGKNASKTKNRLLAYEETVDAIKKSMDLFMDRMHGDELSDRDNARLHIYRHAITDIERIGDHAVNISEAADAMATKKLKFSPQASKELNSMFLNVERSITAAMKSVENEDLDIMPRLTEMEKKTDAMERKFKAGHIARLDKGVCSSAAGVIFIEILRNLERVGDHAYNIGGDVMFLKPTSP